MLIVSFIWKKKYKEKMLLVLTFRLCAMSARKRNGDPELYRRLVAGLGFELGSGRTSTSSLSLAAY